MKRRTFLAGISAAFGAGGALSSTAGEVDARAVETAIMHSEPVAEKVFSGNALLGSYQRYAGYCDLAENANDLMNDLKSRGLIGEE